MTGGIDMDMDAAGGVVTGGMLASAVEKPTGHAGDHPAATCSDCGAPVEGKFCSSCGQPTHVHRTLLHLGEELLHGVMHFDARVWRTLPLLAFNPGRLTREWVQGRRTRYVSPLALFLFTIFLLFFILSFAGGGTSSGSTTPLPEQIAEAEAALTESRTALAEVKAQAGADPSEPGIEGVVAGAEQATAAVERRLESLKAQARGETRPDGLQPGSWQAQLKDNTRDVKFTSDASGIGAKVMKKLQNPELVVYKLQQTMYKYAFLLVPLSIPFMGLLFVWKRGFTFYDHGVFVLYSLTFVSILGMAIAGLIALNQTLGGFALTLGTLWVPVHMFFQLKGAYSLRVWSALWRTFLLLNFCTMVIAIFAVAVIYLGLGI